MEDRPTVLLVDDEPKILKATARYLRRSGFHVVESDSPFGVSRLVLQHRPAVVVLDYMMPALDGGQLSKLLTQQSRRVPLIFYSAMDEEQLYKAVAGLDGADYVSKTDGVDALVAAVRDALGA